MEQKQSPEPQFGKWRQLLWPIHASESYKFLGLFIMQMIVLYGYNVLRGTKDALVVSEGGAAIIPFLKGYVVFPASILFVYLYTKLVDRCSKMQVYTTVTLTFALFFGAFAFVLFPNQAFFHPNPEFIAELKTNYPTFTHFFSILQNWSYACFYVMSELWGSVMNLLLFWGFANEIVSTNQAKRFYGLLVMSSALSNFASGGIVKYFSHGVSLQTSIQLICGSVLAGCAVLIVVYSTMRKSYANKVPVQQVQVKKPKEKLSFFQSLKILFGSKYLRLISALVMCYAISINLVELLWKNQLHLQYHSTTEYNHFMGNLFIGTGIGTMIVSFLSKNVVGRFGWFAAAVITPMVFLVTGLLFVACLYLGNIIDPLASLLGASALLMSCWIGTVQNILCKSTKYGIFDPTKEMAYIPLEDSVKAKGKAAVDVIGHRMGKATGGYFSSVLLMAAPLMGIESTVSGISPFLVTIFCIIIGIWIFAVFELNKLYRGRIGELVEKEASASPVAGSASSSPAEA